MSQPLFNLEKFENTLLKYKIKYYHVGKYYQGSNDCFKIFVLFVTSDDIVYGINIPVELMTPSYICVLGQYKFNYDFEKLPPIEIEEFKGRRIREFHFGKEFFLAESEDNKLYSWGNNNRGQLGRQSDKDSDCEPKEILYFTNSESKIKQICVNFWTIMVVLENGKVVVWGDNFMDNRFKSGARFDGYMINLLYDGDLEELKYPTEIKLLNEIVFVDMNHDGCYAIDKNYNVFSWGLNQYGQLGHKSPSFISYPENSKILSNLKIRRIKSHYDTSYLLTSDGKLYLCGKDCENNDPNNDGINLIQIKSDEYFIELESIHTEEYWKFFVLSDKPDVYEVNGKELIETAYKSIEEYSIRKCKKTYGTIDIEFYENKIKANMTESSLKDSSINLTDEIGHGGFGKVYKVFFQTQYYAIKKVLMNEQSKSYLDANRELQIMKQLKSDFVVNLYDYWTKSENDFKFLYIQMELCDQTLKDIIITKNSSIPPIIDYNIKIEIFGQILFALNYLHSMTPKVIHRDIKPSNVLIKYHNDHAQCKLCDFGLSKILEKESSNTSSVGTIGYKAPEISTNNYNEKVDIYSLGIIIQELSNNFLMDNIDEVVNIKLQELRSVINKMIYSPPAERPSAVDLLKNMKIVIIEKNQGVINLITKAKKELNYNPLKFLNNSKF